MIGNCNNIVTLLRSSLLTIAIAKVRAINFDIISFTVPLFLVALCQRCKAFLSLTWSTKGGEEKRRTFQHSLWGKKCSTLEPINVRKIWNHWAGRMDLFSLGNTNSIMNRNFIDFPIKVQTRNWKWKKLWSWTSSKRNIVHCFRLPLAIEILPLSTWCCKKKKKNCSGKQDWKSNYRHIFFYISF